VYENTDYAQKVIKTTDCVRNCHHSTHIHAERIATRTPISVAMGLKC